MGLALFLFYLASVAENLQITLYLLGSIALCLYGIFWLVAVIEEEDDWKSRLARNKSYTVMAVVMLLVATLLPSKHFLYVASGYVAGVEVAQTEVAHKSVQLLDQRLDELLNNQDE